MAPCQQCGFSDPLVPDDSDPRQRLENLEMEISHVKTYLAQIIRKRAPPKQDINNVFSPIIRLPLELSSEIFLAACLTNDCRDNINPLFLGSVCKQWRELIWSMPQLWTTLSTRVDKRSDQHISLLREWLARSGQHPLSIRLRHSSERQDANSDYGFLEGRVSESSGANPKTSASAALAVPRIIASVSERWCHIDFVFPEAYYQAFHLVKNRLPLLTSIFLDIFGTYKRSFELFSAAPNLRDVQVRPWLRRLILPLAQITRIHFTTLRINDCLEILRSSPRLVHCTFNDVMPSNPSPLVPVHLQLETLSVALFINSGCRISDLLDAISLPVAQELVLDTAYALGVFPHSSFIDFIARSACTLRRLSLARILIRGDSLMECLRALPGLVELELRDVSCMDEAMRMLHPLKSASTASGVLLPNLRTLSVGVDALQNVGEVVSMISARWRLDGLSLASTTPEEKNSIQVAQLQAFKMELWGSEWVNNHLYIKLARLEEQGMRISWMSEGKTWFLGAWLRKDNLRNYVGMID